MIDNNEAERYIIIEVIIILTIQQECRGRSPLPGFGVFPLGVNLTIFERDCKGPQSFAGVQGIPPWRQLNDI
jgi:hypothetical protein